MITPRGRAAVLEQPCAMAVSSEGTAAPAVEAPLTLREAQVFEADSVSAKPGARGELGLSQARTVGAGLLPARDRAGGVSGTFQASGCSQRQLRRVHGPSLQAVELPLLGFDS